MHGYIWNIIMKILYSLLVGFLSFCANAQNGKLLLDVKGLPVRDGKIYQIQHKGVGYCLRTEIDGIEISSKTDSVFSVIDGTIRAVFGIDGDTVVMVMNNKASLFFTFFSIRNVSIKKGDGIKKGDFIGLLKPDDDNLPNLRFMISDNKGLFQGEEKTIAFLKKINPQVCSSNDQPIVAR
jgi:hypothetical protein